MLGIKSFNCFNEGASVYLEISILWPIPVNSMAMVIHDSLSVERSVSLGLPAGSLLHRGQYGMGSKLPMQVEKGTICTSGADMPSLCPPAQMQCAASNWPVCCIELASVPLVGWP